jgi:hypothetical protein
MNQFVVITGRLIGPVSSAAAAAPGRHLTGAVRGPGFQPAAAAQARGRPARRAELRRYMTTYSGSYTIKLIADIIYNNLPVTHDSDIVEPEARVKFKVTVSVL